MTDEELNRLTQLIAKRYSELNEYYITMIARQIKTIGELNPRSLDRVAQMVRMNANIDEIMLRLKELTELTAKDVREIMERVAEDELLDTRFKGYYSAKSGVPEEELTPDIAEQYAGTDARERLRRTALSMAAQTAGKIVNLSNTTAVSEPYREAVDKAIMAVTEGVTSYTEATREVVRSIGESGMQVVYESGYHRRLDTAVRQNILDATGQLAQNAAVMVGEALDYNGFEISAHAMSAPDHEPIQGHVFLREEYYKLQQDSPATDADGVTFPAMRRPIGEWNCRHFAYPFDTRYSKRTYTPEQLQKFIDDNKRGCTVGDRHMTLYEASQLMRSLETKIRREKDTAVAAQAAGDEGLRTDCQIRINDLSKTYKEVTEASGLKPRRERMTVEGFRRVLTNDEKQDILKARIEAKNITTTLNEDKQNPHILNAKGYSAEDHKSFFTVPLSELQKIVNEEHLTGIIFIKKNGQIKETIVIPEGIAYVVTPEGKNLGTTNRATIHYSKKRTHIVPSERVND